MPSPGCGGPEAAAAEQGRGQAGRAGERQASPRALLDRSSHFRITIQHPVLSRLRIAEGRTASEHSFSLNGPYPRGSAGVEAAPDPVPAGRYLTLVLAPRGPCQDITIEAPKEQSRPQQAPQAAQQQKAADGPKVRGQRVMEAHIVQINLTWFDLIK